MTANKINGYGAPYRSQTFQEQASYQTNRNGLLAVSAPVTSGGGTVTVPEFSFIQNGLIVDTEGTRTFSVPSLAAPYYLVVTAPTPSQLDDLLFSFAKTPEDLTTNDIIVAAYDGYEWRSPQLLSVDGVYKDIDQANIDFGRVGPYSGLQTTLSGSNYLNSPGVIVDPNGLRQELLNQASFPVVVTDPDYPRVDRIVYRKPADSPNRIGIREFLLGGTYAASPQSSHGAVALANTKVHGPTKVLIGTDNAAHVLCATGYGGSFQIFYTKISSDRTTMLVAPMALQATTESGFDAAIDGSNNIHLITVNSSHIYYAKYGPTGSNLVAATLIDAQVTPNTNPTVSIDPANTKVFVAYQSLLGASNNQIFFTTRDLSGNLITAPANVTGNASNLQTPSIFVTGDLIVYIAWCDTTLAKIYFQTFTDIGGALTSPTYVSGAVNRIGYSALTDGALAPKVWVTDNQSVFVTFLQNKGSSLYGLSIWNDGVSFMQTLLASGENFTAYALYVDSTFNGVDLVLAQASTTDYVKLAGVNVTFTLNLAGTAAASVATVRDARGSMFHAWADPLASGFQTAYTTASIKDIGPDVLNNTYTVVLTSSQLLILKSLFSGEQPQIGDQVTVSGSGAGNNGAKTISLVETVSFVTTNDYYRITVTAPFASVEHLPPSTLGAFASPNGNALHVLKSTSELTTNAFQLVTMATDLLLARISMPGSHIVNYLPPGVTVALDATLFVPHGNNVSIDWGATTLGDLTISGGLQLLDMLHDQNYTLVDGSYPMVDDDALYVVCDGVDFAPTPQVTAVNTLPFSTPIIVLGVTRDGKFNPALLAVAAITQLDVGEVDVVGEDLPLSQRERLGILSETSYRPYSVGTEYVINEGMDHAQAIGALDTQIGAIVNNNPKEAYWIGDGSTTIFDISTATLTNGTFAWLNDATHPDITCDYDGRKLPFDPLFANGGFRKNSTTAIQLAAAPDIGTLVTVRREGTSTGGVLPPAPGNLWSDQVDHDIVPPADTYKVGTASSPFAEMHTDNGFLKQLSIATALGNCTLLRTKTNGAGTTIAAGYPVSLYSDGQIYPGMALGAPNVTSYGIALQAIAPAAQGKVLLFGLAVPGVLTGLGFSPGDTVYISETGTYTNGSTGLGDTGDVIARIGWADCADATVSGTAVDLVLNYEKILEVENPAEDRILTVSGQTDYNLPTLVLSADNSILDCQLWYDTGYQRLDGSGSEGFKKLSTTSIRLSSAPTDDGREMVFRKEGIAITTSGGGSFDIANIVESPQPSPSFAGSLDIGSLTRPWSGIIVKDDTTNQVWRLSIDSGVIQAVQIGTYP